VLEPSNAAKVAAAATAATSATTALAADTVVGQELWAYIPSKVMPNMYRLADKKYQDKHRYYVDASPTVADICTSNCTDDATAVWKTILVGGLGRGGRAYYALDITDPANPKALWEFSDANLGYSYGPPKIAKKSDGTWVVLLTTGYNNIPNDDGTGGDGVGRLFVVNAATGAQIAGVSPLSTGVGDTTTPSGLSKITAPVISPSTDSTIVAVYGGDLLGNLWRFDINNEIGAAGVDAQLFAVLKDGTGKRQPITTRPIVSLVKKRYIVLVGTGQFLDTSDALATDQQSFYGLVDHFDNATTPSTAIYDNPGGAPRLSSAGLNSNGFIMQKLTEVNCPTGAPVYLCSTGEKVQTSSNVQVDFNVHNGWFIDLINSSERVNLDPALALGTLVFNTNAPSSVSCDLGGKSYQYWLDYKSGSAILAPGNPGIAGKKLGDSLVNAPSLYETPGGLRVGTQLPCVGPTCFRVDVPPVSNEASLTRRTSWRELIAE
jgi:type IV pilus assembly protein PilY1